MSIKFSLGRFMLTAAVIGLATRLALSTLSIVTKPIIEVKFEDQPKTSNEKK